MRYVIYRVSRAGERFMCGETTSREEAEAIYDNACKYGLVGQKIILEEEVYRTSALREFTFTKNLIGG